MKQAVFVGAGLVLAAAIGLQQAGYIDLPMLSSQTSDVFDAAAAPREERLAQLAQPPAMVPSTEAPPAPMPPATTPPPSPPEAMAPSPPVAASKPAQAPAAPPAGPVQPQVAAGPQPPVVDETALRYFAAKGDAKRLEAEIARLRSLYPQWIPPADPLAVRQQTDSKLDQMWKLYSEGKLTEVRQAIADRQSAEPNWQPPADLLQRLTLAEAREQLVNASNLKQYETVIRLGSLNASLLTCGDVDVLWRVAEAFALTDRQDRARDAYLYVLNSCDKPDERLATAQKALPLLTREGMDQLLATARTLDGGKDEFAAVRAELARRSLAAADADATLVIPQPDIAAVEALANEGGLASDDLLLGWYYVRRDNPKKAETWFRRAVDKEETAGASQGLALALIDLDRPGEAEDILYKWRDANDEVTAVYVAAVANLLAVTPPPQLSDEVLQRMALAVADARDAASAQQFGWYADGLNQFRTAAQWFTTALDWKPDDEPSAYGLALMRWKLGDKAGVSEIQTAWAGRSERIPTVGERSIETAAVGTQRRLPARTEPLRPVENRPAEETASALPGSDIVYEQQQPAPRAIRPTAQTRTGRVGCTATQDPSGLAPDTALALGWCLMEMNRPVEAAAAFEAALSGSAKTRGEAAYGQSLAYLRVGLSDKAAVAATKAPLDANRGIELRTALLASQATSAFQQGRYMETLMALDERAGIAPERTDLMVLRGYAYLNLRRYSEAEQVFRAASGTGNREALRGLSDVHTALQPESR